MQYLGVRALENEDLEVVQEEITGENSTEGENYEEDEEESYAEGEEGDIPVFAESSGNFMNICLLYA
jgi:hypothetical protein